MVHFFSCSTSSHITTKMAEPNNTTKTTTTITRLTYFRGRGVAETTRWMLAALEIDFEAIGLERHEQFEDLKSSGKLLFNQLPLLEIDGLNLTQSSAMVQYLARKGNLYGDTQQEAAKCDMVYGLCRDFASPPMRRCFQRNQTEALEALQSCLDKFGPVLEKAVNTESGFMVGNRISFADIVLAEALTSYVECIGGCLDKYPKLKALQSNIVTTLPGVQKYLNSNQRWPLQDDVYVINVCKVLRRPLPSNFPNPNRFVVTLPEE